MTRPDFKYLPCRVCGEPVEVSKYCSRAPRCAECAIAAMAANNREISGKSGPAYEAWLAAGGARGRPRGAG